MDRDTRWRSAFRHCVKSRKVAGSIHDGVTRILHCLIPSRRTMALGSIQPLTEMNTRNYFLGLTTLPPSCADCQHPGNSREHPGLYMDWFNFNSMEHSPPGRENICWSSQWIPSTLLNLEFRDPILKFPRSAFVLTEMSPVHAFPYFTLLSLCLRLDAPKFFLSHIKMLNPYLTHVCHLSLPSHPCQPYCHNCSHLTIVFKFFFNRQRQLWNWLWSGKSIRIFQFKVRFCILFKNYGKEPLMIHIFYGLNCQIYWSVIYLIK